MSVQIFNIPGWSFTPNDQRALNKLDILRNQSTKQLPSSYKSKQILYLFQQITKTKLYHALQTLPKGVIHHLHFDCSEDKQFYKKYIIPDPIVYLSSNLASFKIGTKQQALQQKWLSLKQARQQFNTQQNFQNRLCNLTILSKSQIQMPQEEHWRLFQEKISNFFPLLYSLHIFKKYIEHILRKYIKNGYDRLQFRCLLSQLNQYNQTTGQLLKIHPQQKFMQIFDQVFQKIKKQYPIFSVGFIFFGLRQRSPEDNQKALTSVLQKKWPKTVGIDFVQQQGTWSQQPFDQIANKVLQKFPQQNIKKVYHAGQTNNHLNNNVQIAINAGSFRIGHGINIIQHPQLIQICRKKRICFEKNPVSNLLLGYVPDPRISTAQLLLGLGVPVTINPDDPGKFGLQDTTMDYFVTFVSTNWNLKHLKLIGLHSINHAIISQQLKKQLHNSFNQRWNQWINKFISTQSNLTSNPMQITKNSRI